MALSPQQIDRLLKKTQQTREVEMTCPDCLDELDKYTEQMLDGTPIEGVLLSVREHLDDCLCCTAQFNLVLDTLQSIEEP